MARRSLDALRHPGGKTAIFAVDRKMRTNRKQRLPGQQERSGQMAENVARTAMMQGLNAMRIPAILASRLIATRTRIDRSKVIRHARQISMMMRVMRGFAMRCMFRQHCRIDTTSHLPGKARGQHRDEHGHQQATRQKTQSGGSTSGIGRENRIHGASITSKTAIRIPAIQR